MKTILAEARTSYKGWTLPEGRDFSPAEIAAPPYSSPPRAACGCKLRGVGNLEVNRRNWNGGG